MQVSVVRASGNFLYMELVPQDQAEVTLVSMLHNRGCQAEVDMPTVDEKGQSTVPVLRITADVSKP